MEVYFLSALLLGFAGNIHCLGMCGPLAMALPVHNQGRSYKIMGLISYNLGRVLMYGLLGLLFGFLGKGLVIAGFQRYLSVGSGILIILFVLFPNVFTRFQYTGWFILLKNSMSKFIKKKGMMALFTLGWLNGLLPCGLLYMALTAALASGNPANASFFMILFGVATVPGLISLGFLMSIFKMKNKVTWQVLSPVFTLTIALVLILRGLNLGIPYFSPKITTPYEKASCCHH